MELFVAIPGGQLRRGLLITTIANRTMMGSLSWRLFLLTFGSLSLEDGLIGIGFGELREEAVGVD